MWFCPTCNAYEPEHCRCERRPIDKASAGMEDTPDTVTIYQMTPEETAGLDWGEVQRDLLAEKLAAAYWTDEPGQTCAPAAAWRRVADAAIKEITGA
jgi:hypothetical protein